MGLRISHRRRSRIVAAAALAGAVGVGGFSDSRADGGLVVDLRVLNSPNPKYVPFVNVGDTITIDIFARVSGSNAVRTTGNYDGFGGNNDTRNDDSVKILTGSFASTGLLKGDFVRHAGGDAPMVDPFQAGGHQNGTFSDWDGDGDLDIGGAGTDITQMWEARAANPIFGTRFVNPFNATMGTSPPFFPDPLSILIDASVSEVHMGTLYWIVKSTSGDTEINFVPFPVSTTASAMWFEDGVITARHPGDGDFTVGPPIIVGFVPEPASIAAMAVASSIGLLARRKRYDRTEQ